MALPAQEAFAAGAANLPNPPWTDASTGGTHVATKGTGNGGITTDRLDAMAFWNNDTFASDQYSQFVAKFSSATNTTNAYIYLTARHSGTYAAMTGYWFWLSGGDTAIAKVTGGSGASPTIIDTANGTSFVSGDVFKLEVIGSTIKAYKNGAAITWTTSGTTSVTDSSIASGGAPGTGGWGNTAISSTVLFDDWEGNNTAVAGNTLSGGPTLANVTVTGALAETSVLSGGPTLARVTVTGSLAETSVLSGGPTLANVTVTGTLAETSVLSGGPTLANVTVTGALAETSVISGGPTLAGVTVTGALNTTNLSGAVTLRGVTVTGTITVPVVALTYPPPAAPRLTAASAATVSRATSAAAATAPRLTASSAATTPRALTVAAATTPRALAATPAATPILGTSGVGV